MSAVNATASAFDGTEFVAFSTMINELLLPRVVLENAPFGHFGATYLRNLFAGVALYLSAGCALSWYCYATEARRARNFPDPSLIPTRETLLEHVRVSMFAMPFYTLYATFDDWLVCNGWTQAYMSVSEVGGLHMWLLWTCIYMCLVEIGIYWMHRSLHTNKWLYRNIHAPHHKYKTAATLSPFASVAFHPLDGVLQASPYTLVMMVVPTHWLTHMVQLFFTAVWATYIHDGLEGDTEPIMGSKYHLVHHTHFTFNYGQFFTFCDSYWGTLCSPADIASRKAARAAQKKRA